MQLFVYVLALIQRMSSCITASVVKITLPGLRSLEIKQYFSRTVCIAERIKRNRIVNSGLRRLPSHPEM